MDLVATGHTQTDQAETVLIRLLRGTGLAGLSGVAPLRDRVIRPLVDVRRPEVEEFLAARGLRPVRDPSNEDARFLRSRVRAAILPALSAESAGIVETLAGIADEARAVTAPLQADPSANVARRLREALRAAGLRAERRHLQAILRMLRAAPRSEPRAAPCGVPAPGPGTYALPEIGATVEVPASMTPCEVRNRRPGDRLADGSRLRDRMAACDVPPAVRGFVPLVARGRDVLALPSPVGLAAGARFHLDRSSPFARWTAGP
jgi:tRNA(Ile)-lysidine synthase